MSNEGCFVLQLLAASGRAKALAVGLSLASFLVVAAPSGRVSADLPPRTADVFRSASSRVERGDEIEIRCTVRPAADTGGIFFAKSITQPSGKVVSYETTSEFGGGDIFFGVRAGPAGEHVVVLDNPESSPGGSFLRRGSSAARGTLRVAWAGWDRQISCVVKVEGKRIPSERQARARAEYWLITDMTGAALIVGPNPAIDSASMGATLGVARESSGYVFGFMTAEAGSLRVTRPGGEQTWVYGTDRLILSTIGGEDGTWTWTVDAARDGPFPVLYVMRLE